MYIGQSKILENKIIIYFKCQTCDSPEQLISSELFARVLKMAVQELAEKNSMLLDIFENRNNINDEDIQKLIDTLLYAYRMPVNLITQVVKGLEQFLKNPVLLSDFIQYLHDYWRKFERIIIICRSSEEDKLEERPYMTFQETVEKLKYLISKIYCNLQINIAHQSVHQVATGGELAAIVTEKTFPFKGAAYNKLNEIPVIRQICIYPPIILNSPTTKRTGNFEQIAQNPIEIVDIDPEEWLCYPAKVGNLVINIYFHQRFFTLGLSLCNLFELAKDHDLNKCPDAIYLFGIPGAAIDGLAKLPIVFYDDEENNMIVGAVPNYDEFGYFGYLKKMVLTLHNICIMKIGDMPFHGAMARIVLKGNKAANVLLMGDGGAGKSEMLAAFQVLAGEYIQDINIIADDMGSLSINEHGEVIAYGTEIGGFVRLDALNPDYVFSQIDKAIIMNVNKKNARIVLPLTNLDYVTKGYKVDCILYCNNYEEVTEKQPVIERFASLAEAINTFRQGAVMSVGVSSSTGLVHSYFANVFGPAQYRQLHEPIAEKFFNRFFANKLFVGHMRTRLSIKGWERKGPEEAAKELFKIIQNSDW
ncbi:hypothetical protein [Sporomusa acidovorans]|uniref:Phosphoenolpyruvate carboxykinase n=1 Tax=Sporomusa acidovorans (strain ATCC 49682 / DSM 3132 / Mol) TaxID=1123286 RepID=A0ABZ3IYI8_SPOA4|nr:hypothetical protein [Sporomusa acidovorans]OZC22174.1 hypothetical protein SPACI_15250 [Sporomusa acidovorans DSM 3132]SDE82172.1 hypothetical protein SAMN04488499_102269 [Sporomusa acidovorans]